MKLQTLLGLGVVSLALAGPATSAKADPILSFGQVGNTKTITGVATTTATTASTTITATGVKLTITQIDGNPPLSTPITAYLNLSATSTAAASVSSGMVTQKFGGTFSITANANGTGTNYLSGVFSDSVFGAGSSLTLSVANDAVGETVTYTSDVITSLESPRALSLAFAAVSPAVATVSSGNGLVKTLRGFQSSVSGTFSAVPEPTTIAAVLSGLPVVVLGLYRHRRSKVA